MSIEDPISYADWYWKHSVDALRTRSEQAEKSYAPVIQQILDDSGLSKVMPDSLRPLFGNLTAPSDPDWDDIQRPLLSLYTRAIGLIAGEEIARPTAYALKAATPTLKIDADMAAMLTQRRKMTDAVFNVYAGFAGYDDNESREFYNSRIPYPSIPDIITASRYLGDATNPKPYAMTLFDIPENDWMIWDWLTYQKFTTEQVLELHRTKFWDDFAVDRELARLGWRGDDSIALKKLAYEIPNAMLLVQGSLVRDMSDDTIIDLISRGGIHPDYAHDYLDAVLIKPASQDVIAYELRRDPSLSNLSSELHKIGVHENYHGLYRELAYQIPPVADIITMAVREAFTPEIAARFGQYQDLPSEFVEWVGKKGLSREWAERYWAAHWSLPSPQQGFEMLHRGIIGRDDLHTLLRALDIMPFWRDKLVEMAYTRFTRIDIRRMYNIGVMTVSDVKEAYVQLGYNDANANLMTRFVVRLKEVSDEKKQAAIEKADTARQEAENKAVQKKREAEIKAAVVTPATWTNAQTLTFYKKGIITQERANHELELLGYDAERIKTYFASVVVAP